VPPNRRQGLLSFSFYCFSTAHTHTSHNLFSFPSNMLIPSIHLNYIRSTVWCILLLEIYLGPKLPQEVKMESEPSSIWRRDSWSLTKLLSWYVIFVIQSYFFSSINSCPLLFLLPSIFFCYRWSRIVS